MANRYDIIHIDFQASARGANAAIESIRKEAEKSSNSIADLKKKIEEGLKANIGTGELDSLRMQLRGEERKLKQLTQAQNELVKGMRVLDQAVKNFNDGSLQEMNAAFQKSANNAAKLAQSKMEVGTKEWREMGAIMQETERNYARMQRDTDQLIESLQNGGMVYRKTIEDEKRGLQDLLQVLPYMSTEYRKAEEQLNILVKTTDEMAIKERQARGEIVTTNDARRVSYQLSKEGAEAARQRAAAADEEIEKGKQVIVTLEEEKKARETEARASAQAAAEYRENQQMYEDEIARIDKEIRKENERANSKKIGIEALKRTSAERRDDADKEIDAQKKLDSAYDTAKEKTAKLRAEIEQMKQAVSSFPDKDPATEAVKVGAEEASTAVKQETNQTKESTEAIKDKQKETKKLIKLEDELKGLVGRGGDRETKSTEKQVEAEKKVVAVKDKVVKSAEDEEKEVEKLIKANIQLKAEIEELYKEREKLLVLQKQGATATKEEAHAFSELTGEQAQALLEESKELATFKKSAGKWQVTNREEAQQYLFDVLGEIDPDNLGKSSLSLQNSPENISQLLGKFQSRYGLKSEGDAKEAIMNLMTEGGLIKSGFMNKQFLNLEQDLPKISAYRKEIEALTEVINGESKAEEKEVETHRALAEVEAEIADKEKQSIELSKQTVRMRMGVSDTISKQTQKQEELSASQKENIKVANAEIEAIKKLNKEQAEAAKKEMMAVSTIGYKAGKLDFSNLEEVQHFLISQIKKNGYESEGGRLTLSGKNVNNLLTAFQNRYNLREDKATAKSIFKELIQGKHGGMINKGGIVDFQDEQIDLYANVDAFGARIDKIKALISVTNGMVKATEKVTDATKEETDSTKNATMATEKQTDAIRAQEQEVMRRKAAFEKAKDIYATRKQTLDDKKAALSKLPKSGTDALLARQQAKDDIEDYNEDFVKPARADKTKLEKLWKKSVNDLLQMQDAQREATEEIKKGSEATRESTKATKESAEATEKKTRGKKKSAEATKEETEADRQLAAKQKELEQAEAEEAAALKKKEEQQKKTAKAVNDAVAAESKANEAEKNHIETMKDLESQRTSNINGLNKLNEENKDTIANNEKTQKMLGETNSKLQEQGDKIREAERIKAQAQTEGIEKTEQAIRLLTEENRRIDQNSFTWKRNTIEIQHLQAALDEMKNKPALLMMEQRMKNVGSLSASAVTETKRFWEQMVAGAEKGSNELKEYEAHLKVITEEERKRSRSALEASAKRLSGNLGNLSQDELRQSINDAKLLQSSYKSTSKEAQTLAQAIVNAEEHVKRYGVEAERAARKQEESDKRAVRAARDKEEAERKAQQEQRTMMQERAMLERNRTTLSATALAETKKYWQAVKEGAEEGSVAQRNALRIMEKITAEEQRRNNESNRKKAGILGGTLSNYSEGEIREAIEAGKQLILTYKSGSKEAENMGKNIAAAEEHIKNVGLEAQRAAVRQEQAVAKIRTEGADTLSRARSGEFATASMDDIDNAIKKLREYQSFIKDPEGVGKETFDATKQQVDALTAKLNALKGEWMSYADAKKLAEQAGTKDFVATPQEIQQATQALERRREQVIKNMNTNRKATAEEEKELNDLTQQLRNLKFEQDNYNMSQEKMQMLMETPKNAVNLEELRGAIKRADAELRLMEGSLGKNSKEYKDFAEKVRNAKNVLKDMEGQAKATSTAWEKAWSRLKTYVGLYMGFNIIWQKATGTFSDILDLSDKMGEVRKTTNFTAEEVGHLSEELKKLDTRTTINGLLDLSAAAGQLGLKTEQDVLGFTEAANKLMVALPEMGKEGATEMLKVALATGEIDKIGKQMEEGLIDGSSATAVAMEKVGSTIDRLRATSAATAPAITDFVKRVGAVGAQSGISIDQVAALGSTVDALGMRVEMSATALSRMLPAIRNNAFALAHAIGVTPEVIRDLFDAGRGMEVILMILQRIKDSNMDADSIEQMMGMAGMKDIMKDLNQQGARAGIVFSGLSQNVDTLRKHLVTASEAYKENTAIQKEYDKMNDTTAAKLERLKNQVVEFFVGDSMQKFLGIIFTGVRKIINLLTDDSGWSVATRTILAYFAVLKLGIADILKSLKEWRKGLKEIGIATGIINEKTKKIMWGNIYAAAAAAVLYLVYALQSAAKATSAVAKAIAELEEELQKELGTLDRLFHAVNKTNAVLEAAQSRLEEVKKANEDTTDAENRLKKANADHAATIREINSKYGSYLGYMLSETASAEQLARARELINSKLRETITLKQREAALGAVEQEYGKNVNEKGTTLENAIESLFGNNYKAAANVSLKISEAAQKYTKDSDKFSKEVNKILKANSKYIDKSKIEEVIKGHSKSGDQYSSKEAVDLLTSGVVVSARDYRKEMEEYKRQEDVVNNRFDAQVNVTRRNSRERAAASLNAIQNDWMELLAKYRKASGGEKKKLAADVYKQQRAYANAFSNNADYFEGDKRKKLFETNIKNMSSYEKGLRKVAGEAIRTIDALERAETKVTNTDFTTGGNSGNNPWGNTLPAESTDWKNMTAEQLVNRRKQMNEFVNAIQTDSDVQSVLKEDSALKAAIEKGMSSDMRTVIEWYNTERLKIQDELHARHLTNTGDWMDPKKEKARRKRLQDDMKAYLEELDAYYTERKTRIQEAGNEEGLTEAEVRNRTLANEMEWRQRRAELQIMYSAKTKQVAEDEQKAIAEIIAERTGDDAKYIKATIDKTRKFSEAIRAANEQGAKEYRKFQGDLDLGSQRDFNKVQMALRQQLKAIRDIIEKERPFNGITKNLRENLVTMGILTADMSKERDRLMKEGADMADFNARQAAEEFKRTTFMLGEAENAYSTTIEDVMRRMADNGMAAWADELRSNPEMQEGMMAQLRATYDAIQDSIKKEASQWKKQAEIMWNNIFMPDGKTTLKQTADRMMAQLSLDEGRVQRANSLIGAGQASERVADKLAIKQMQIQLSMQEHYYNLMRKRGQATIDMLDKQAKKYREMGDIARAERIEQEKKNAAMALNLATAKEETELAKQREEIIARTEESQNRLYRHLREWADLLTSGIRDIMEASHAGEAEYYDELAKMNLTGSGGPGAGTYIVIDNAGTDKASAHYEYLDERQALERQREIERENAQAEAWKKVWDELNNKMSESITDWINAALQNTAIDTNTSALNLNTAALYNVADAIQTRGEKSAPAVGGGDTVAAAPDNGTPIPFTEEGLVQRQEMAWAYGEVINDTNEQIIEGSEKVTEALTYQFNKQASVAQGTNRKIQTSTQSTFARMTLAANMYGIAYQAMSNENLSTTQKFEMMALQAVGNYAIGALTAEMAAASAKAATDSPGVFGTLWKQLGWAATPVFAIFTGLLGGMMGLAMSKISKAKSTIAQATGSSVGAGRLATGMLTYAEGNVNEFTDPNTLTPGRHYNVDGADGKTYRAKYMGKGAKTHITSGPEFHLVGEAGREAIIDAHTTRNIQLNEPEIWRSIQTLYNGGSLKHATQRRGAGVAAFADGNIGDFDDARVMTDGSDMAFPMQQLAALQAGIDRQNILLERALNEGIKGVFDVYGKGGLVDSYDSGKKTLKRYGQRY